MKSWKDITLFQFQAIEQINSRKDLGDDDKVLYSVCAVFNMTEYQLDNTKPRKAAKLINAINKIFSAPFIQKAYDRIGLYFLNYNPGSMTFGQYVELCFFLQQPIQHAHYILASISNRLFFKEKVHKKRAEYFSQQPITKVIGSVTRLQEAFAEFNKEFNNLFGLSEKVHDPAAKVDKFNKRYGWTFSAERVADYERITIDEAYKLPVRQALNALTYLKAKDDYIKENTK